MIIEEQQNQSNGQNPSMSVTNSIDPSKVPEKPQPEKPQKGDGSRKSIVAVAIIIVIAALLLVLYFTGTLSHLISYSSTSKVLFTSVNSSAQLDNAIVDLVNSSNAFNISYTGSYVNESTNSSLFGSSESKEFINSSVAKYGNDFKIFFNATPSIYVAAYIIQNRNNLTYCYSFYGISCYSYLVNFTPSQYIAYNYVNSIIQGAVNETGALINTSASDTPPGVSNVKIMVKYLGQSTYDGNKCSKVLDSVNASFNSSNIMGELNGSSVLCYSDVFGLPLSGNVKLFENLTLDGYSESKNLTSVIVSHINKAPSGYKQVNISSLYNPTESSVNGSSCGNFALSLSNYPAHVYGECSWSGGDINVTYAGGNSGYASVSIVGQNGKTYFSNSTTARGNCYLDATNVVYLPTQNYIVRLGAGGGGGQCGNAFVTLS